jgi:hypothetical protein
MGRRTTNTIQTSYHKAKFKANKSPSKIRKDGPEYSKRNKSTLLIGHSFSDEDELSGEINSDMEGAVDVLGLTRTKSTSKAPPKAKPKSHTEILSEVLDDDDDEDLIANPDSSVHKKEGSELDAILSDDGDSGRYDYIVNDDEDLQIRDETFFLAQREKIIADGKAKNYPTTFNREDVIEHSDEFIPTLEKIIMGKTNSYYHNQAETELTKYFSSVTKSRDPAVHRHKFGTLAACDNPMSIAKSTSLKGLSSDSGYYGEQGQELLTKRFSALLFDVFEKYVRGKEIESTSNWWMRYFGFTNYLILVLVPETLTYLISQDRDIFDNEARQMLKDSSSYGAIMFPNISGEEPADHSSASDNSDSEIFSCDQTDMAAVSAWNNIEEGQPDTRKRNYSSKSLGESKRETTSSDILLDSDEEKQPRSNQTSNTSLLGEAPKKKTKVTGNSLNKEEKFVAPKRTLSIDSTGVSPSRIDTKSKTANDANIPSHRLSKRSSCSSSSKSDKACSNNPFSLKLSGNKLLEKKPSGFDNLDHKNHEPSSTKDCPGNTNAIRANSQRKKIEDFSLSNSANSSPKQNQARKSSFRNSSQTEQLKSASFNGKTDGKSLLIQRKPADGFRSRVKMAPVPAEESKSALPKTTKPKTSINIKVPMTQEFSDSDDDSLSNIFSK